MSSTDMNISIRVSVLEFLTAGSSPFPLLCLSERTRKHEINDLRCAVLSDSGACDASIPSNQIRNRGRGAQQPAFGALRNSTPYYFSYGACKANSRPDFDRIRQLGRTDQRPHEYRRFRTLAHRPARPVLQLKRKNLPPQEQPPRRGEPTPLHGYYYLSTLPASSRLTQMPSKKRIAQPRLDLRRKRERLRPRA